jgi:rubrerythrin
MKQCTLSLKMLVAGLFSVLVLVSCQKRSEEATSTKKYATLENLQTAYAAESRRCRWYTRFVQQAQKDRLINAAALFKAIARSEKIHADNHAHQIHVLGGEPNEVPIDSIPIGVTRQTLKLALSAETFECESLYPVMVRTAENEKLPDVVRQFKQTKEADARHKELFQNAVQYSGNIPQMTYWVCPECGYIVTSVKTDQCPTCSTKKDKFEKI